jgi:hypothetical protein
MSLDDCVALLNDLSAKGVDSSSIYTRLAELDPVSLTESSKKKPLGTSPPIALSLLTPELRLLANKQGRIEYKQSETLVYRLFGKSGFDILNRHLLNDCGFLGYAVHTFVSIIIVFLGFFLMVPPALFVCACVSLGVHTLLISVLVYDLRIVRVLVQRWVWLWTSALGCSATICMYALLQFDFRTAAAGPFLFVIGLVTLFDATSSLVRFAAATLYVSANIAVWVVVAIIANLGRFPNQANISFTIGTLGGLSQRPVTYDILSLFNTSVSAYIAFLVHYLIVTYRGARSGHLGSVTVPVLGVNHEEVLEFEYAPRTRRVLLQVSGRAHLELASKPTDGSVA